VNQPASATRPNCRGCDADGIAASLTEAEFTGALDRSVAASIGFLDSTTAR
jgi:hypothetical protein